MKKLILVGSIVLSMGFVSNVSAITIDVTSMTFGDVGVATGTMSTDSLGDTFSRDFFNLQWTGTTIAMFDAPGNYSWAGTGEQGSYTYSFTLTEGQIAWGLYFSWSVSREIPVLNIMDCGSRALGDVCSSYSMPMQTGPFPKQSITIDGVVSSVPVPAAIWLFASGLIGLLGFSDFSNRREV